MSNRLAGEVSPYLLQHAGNPVDWYPWGDDALDESLRRDVPILLSIGYAACHWCHVMERESFEDPETAAVMNEHFVCVKVDREERPDLDAVYMEAVQMMTGHGGWPMTVFLTPEGVPFFGGTYFPPDDRHGLPGFKKLLKAVAEAWEHKREGVEGQGKKLVEHMGAYATLQRSTDPITSQVLDEAAEGLKKAFDPQYGGFGTAPKFPQPMTIDFLHRLSKRGDQEALKMATQTLDAMAAGGMYDQIGGGFARYSVDREWLVPHFEKMLYDNALLLRTYARSSLLIGSERHRRVTEETVDWMLGEMRAPEGGFYSSLDADSEGVEGRFYVWSLTDVGEAAGPDADVAIAHFGISEQGNWEGTNIPIYAGAPDDPAAIERARQALFEKRSQRVRPATDDKVLVAWNALAASCLAEAGTILDRPAWVTAAADAMGFVLGTLRIDGRLMRSYREGTVKHLGFAEDYAFTLEACLSLFHATGDPKWLAEARWAADESIRLFYDNDRGGFFTTGEDAERLVVRNKDLIDNAVPAANSVLALELQRLAMLTGERGYEDKALEVMGLLHGNIGRSPLGFGHLLGAFDLYTDEPQEIVILGDDPAPFLDVIRTRYMPNTVVVTSPAADPAFTPLLEGRHLIDGRTTAYVCRNMVCKQPVTDPGELAAQLT